MNPVFRWVANGTTTSEWSHETLGAEVPRLSGAPVGIKWRPFGVSTGYRSDLFWALSFSADSGRLTASQLIGKPYFETTCTVLFFQRWAYGYSPLSVAGTSLCFCESASLWVPLQVNLCARSA